MLGFKVAVVIPEGFGRGNLTAQFCQDEGVFSKRLNILDAVVAFEDRQKSCRRKQFRVVGGVAFA